MKSSTVLVAAPMLQATHDWDHMLWAKQLHNVKGPPSQVDSRRVQPIVFFRGTTTAQGRGWPVTVASLLLENSTAHKSDRL